MKNSNRLGHYFLLIMVTGLAAGCSRKPDLEMEMKRLLNLHAQQQHAHLHKNAKQFVSQFAENMLSVNGGKIAVSVKDSALKKFQKYFDQVAFSKWEDVTPPVIEFSADASMAYMVVDKRVVLTYKNKKNWPMEETTHFAWVSVFKKQADGEWRIVCNISTNEPALTKPAL